MITPAAGLRGGVKLRGLLLTRRTRRLSSGVLGNDSKLGSSACKFNGLRGDLGERVFVITCFLICRLSPCSTGLKLCIHYIEGETEPTPTLSISLGGGYNESATSEF